MSATARQVWAILRKDLMIELRRRELVVSMLVFALLIVVTFNFAFDLRVQSVVSVGPGALWAAVLFAVLLNVGRTIVVERDRGAWDGLLAAPLEPGALYLAKLLGNVAFTAAMEVVLVPAFAAIYDLNVVAPRILLALFLGTVGLAAVGTLFAGVLASTRAREAMMPVLLFPLLLPVVIATVKATSESLSPNAVMGSEPWTGLLAAFDLLFVTLGYALFDHAAEE